jgi:type IV secretory pathway TrbD component
MRPLDRSSCRAMVVSGGLRALVVLTGTLGANYLVAALGSVTAVVSLSFTVRGSVRNDDK